MHSDDFPVPSIPSAPVPSKKKRASYKQVAESSEFAAGDAVAHLLWAIIKQPLRSTAYILGLGSILTGIGPFIMGFGGFAASPNAHFSQKLANGVSLYVARPVLNGVVLAATEATLREQNSIANPNNPGTLTAQQVKALQGMRSNGAQIRYVVNRKPR